MKRATYLLAVSVAASVLAGSAFAQDYGYYAASPFEGAYVGGYAGGALDPNVNWTAGGMAGVNFEVTEGVMAGLEMQGGATGGATTTWEGIMLGRGGVVATPEVLAYGALGAGVVNGTNSWAIGGGAEYAATDQLGVRGEVLATGPWGGGLSRTKATAGIVWHVK